MARFKRWYIHVFQLSLGRMNRAPIATFLSFFFSILSFPLLTHAAQVTLAWDASTDPGIAGYKVYYGTSSGNYQVVIDVGKNAGCTISNLQNDSTYYFAVTGYSTSGVESGYSNEIFYSATGTLPPADIPVAGDWTGTGIAKIGVYRQGQWFLDKNGNGIWDGCGVDTCIDSFGLPADIPVAGDWTGTGIAKIGVYRQGQWLLDKNGNGIWDGCGVDTCIDSFGFPADIPVVEDWTGTGVVKLGVYRQGQWYLDKNGNGIWDGCGVDTCIQSFGVPTDIPVVGDWTGTGIERIGTYRRGQWFHDKNGNGTWDGCGVDTCIDSFGR